MMDPAKSLQAAGFQEEDHLTAIDIPVKVAATDQAIALWCFGGNRLVTWGDRTSGGDSSGVAILADASVVTCDPRFHSDSSALAAQVAY